MNEINIQRNILLNPGPATTTDMIFVQEKRNLEM